MEVINSVVFGAWNWLPWLLGLGTVGWLGLALLAPSFLNVLSPILKGMGEGLVEFVKILYEGVTDILDSWKTVVTVIVLIAAFGNYWSFQETKKVAKERATIVHKNTKVTKTPSKVEHFDPFSWVR